MYAIRVLLIHHTFMCCAQILATLREALTSEVIRLPALSAYDTFLHILCTPTSMSHCRHHLTQIVVNLMFHVQDPTCTEHVVRMLTFLIIEHKEELKEVFKVSNV